MARAKAQPDVSFEQQLSRLAEIVEALDAGNAPMEELLKLYEEGMLLTKKCSSYLEGAEQKVIQINAQATKADTNTVSSEPDF
jgi:exodeoxyribonuclease VII small subunit